MHKLVNLSLGVILISAPAQLMAQKPTVEELEQRCEEMRENRLKPLREAEIEKCKADETKDPAWCERYYQDYGNATRGPEGKYTPRMFDDLAPCVEAREMKAKQRESTLPADKRDTTTTDLEKIEKELTTSPEEAAAAQKGKVTPISRDSTLGTTKRDTEKTESTRDSTLPATSRDSSSGKSDR
jgi:hypothetical protein